MSYAKMHQNSLQFRYVTGKNKVGLFIETRCTVLCIYMQNLTQSAKKLKVTQKTRLASLN